MSEGATAAVKSTFRETTKLSTSNPLVEWGTGGLGAALGVWIHGKVYSYLKEKFENIASSKYFEPASKLLTAIVLYAVSKLKTLKSNKMVQYLVRGAGIGLVGSIVSDWVQEKLNVKTSTSTVPRVTATKTPQVTVVSHASSRSRYSGMHRYMSPRLAAFMR